MESKFNTLFNKILNETDINIDEGSTEEGILVRPLSNDQIEQLQAGNNISIKITPDTYEDRFKNAPYNNKEKMESMHSVYSKTMAGEFTFDIIEVIWDNEEILVKIKGVSNEEEPEEEFEDSESPEEEEEEEEVEDSEDKETSSDK